MHHGESVVPLEDRARSPDEPDHQTRLAGDVSPYLNLNNFQSLKFHYADVGAWFSAVERHHASSPIPKIMLHRISFLVALPLALHAAAPWQEITVPSVAELAATWAKPPAEYGAIHWAIGGGEQTKERILTGIERVA